VVSSCECFNNRMQCTTRKVGGRRKAETSSSVKVYFFIVVRDGHSSSRVRVRMAEPVTVKRDIILLFFILSLFPAPTPTQGTASHFSLTPPWLRINRDKIQKPETSSSSRVQSRQYDNHFNIVTTTRFRYTCTRTSQCRVL